MFLLKEILRLNLLQVVFGLVGALVLSGAIADELVVSGPDDNGQNVIVFDVEGLSDDVTITDLTVRYGNADNDVNIKIYGRSGSHVDGSGNLLNDFADWTLLGQVDDLSINLGEQVIPIPLSVPLMAGDLYAFLILSENQTLRYGTGDSGTQAGVDEVASDANLRVYMGTGASADLMMVFQPRQFLGTIYYDVLGGESGEPEPEGPEIVPMPIPTLGEWALILLAGSLGLLAVGRLRRNI